MDLLASWNIQPQLVVGHSSGEIAAAYATGALSLESAITVAYFRGLLSPKVKNLGYDGRMMAVGLSEDEANAEIAGLDESLGKVVVACVNSPRGVTISGDTPAMEELHKSLNAKDIFARLLQVDTAYHSHHMQAIAEEYLARLQQAQVEVLDTDSSVTMFSSVTEDVVDHSQLGADYWVSNLVGCVRFCGALTNLCLAKSASGSQTVDVLLEVGPHSLFKLPVKEVLEIGIEEKLDIQYISTLIRNKPADTTALEAAGQLYANRYPVDLHAANFPTESKQSLSVLTDLPQYPWNHTRRYWYESRLSRDYRLRPFTRTDILGAPVYDWNPIEPRFRNFLRLREQPWLRDHVVQGDVLFPACGYICMAIEACRQMCDISPSTFLPKGSGGVSEYKLREVSISRALVVPETDEGVETGFSMHRQWNSGTGASSEWYEFRVFSYTNDGGWVENCKGLVSVSNQSTADEELSEECLSEWNNAYANGAQQIIPEAFYHSVDSIGLTYGPLFQSLKEISINSQVPDQAAGIIEVSNTQIANPKEFEHDRLLHPATLDSFLQLALAALGGKDLSKLKNAMVPTFVEEISVSANIAAQSGDQLNILVSAEKYGLREARGNIFALDPKTSKPVVLMDGFKFVAINGANESSEIHSPPKHCYKAVWEPDVELINPQSLNKELQAAPRSDDQPKTVRELELLSYYFIDKALQEVKPEEVSSMLPHHQKFYRNLSALRESVLAKTHPQQTEEWQLLRTPEVAAKLQNMAEFYRNHESAYDGKLLVRVGEALPLVFRQEVEPLALMTHENLLEDYYTTAVGMPNTYAQISRYTSMLSHKYPNLDFLEIGAGTGGATVPTLKGLSGCEGLHTYPRLKSYTYTDISSYFFQRAAEKFSDFADFMKFKKLDVEHDPETQDFKPASYDVIVAANVLHATSDMHRTMTHARKLLRPGGQLILLEMTNRLLAASVIFGTLTGWWNASEEWRTEGPLLTEGQWEEVLGATGFSSLQASSPDVLDPLEEGTRLMIATAVETQLTLSNGLPTPPVVPHVIILCADSPVKMNSLDMPLSLKSKMEKSGLQVQISTLSRLAKEDITGAACISFVELDDHFLASLSEQDLNRLKQIAETSAGLIWVTRGAASSNVERPELAVFQGLARTLRAEHEGFSCITVDLDAGTKLPRDEVSEMLFQLYEQRLGPKKTSKLVDSEFLEKEGVLYIKRAVEDEDANRFVVARTNLAALSPQLEEIQPETRPLTLKTPESGPSGPFVFDDDVSVLEPLKPNEVEISVQATNLSTRDVQIINGESPDGKIGQECAGVITRIGRSVSNFAVGDRVATWCPGALATHTRITAAFAHRIPDNVSFEVAATLPLAQVTAHYSLLQVGRLTAGETVLIHDAASLVGQAAIQIATASGAKVFVTIKSEEEKKFLSETYNIKPNHIFSCLDTSFVSALRRATHGRGIDVVLNTLSGEALQATFSCVAPFGRFIELGKNNTQANGRLEMAPFERNVSFSSIDVEFLYQQNPRLAGRVFQNAMRFFLEENLQLPTAVKVKGWSELSEAIDMVQNEKRVVLVPRAGESVLVSSPNIRFMKAQTNIHRSLHKHLNKLFSLPKHHIYSQVVSAVSEEAYPTGSLPMEPEI